MARLTSVNKGGIPALETTGASLTSTAEIYTFNSHPYFREYFQGIFLVKVTGTPTAPEIAVPVYFSSLNNSTVPVNTAQGVAITTATWPGDGVYIMFYDRTTNVLRLLTK